MTDPRHHNPKGDYSLLWMIVAGILIWAAFALLIGSCFGEANSAPIPVSEFHGVATDVDPQDLPPGYARLSVGWVYRDGNLERETFDQLNTGTVISNGLTWLAPWSPDNQILFFDTDLKKYNIDADASYSISGASVDSVTVTNADSTVTQGMPNSRWLNLVLTDRGMYNTISLGGVFYRINHFYSDSVLELTAGYAGATADSVASVLGFGFNPERAGYFENEDTTWLYDGNNLTPYTGSPFSGFAYPTYADSGTIDSVWVDTTSTPANGDSCFVFASNFDDTHEGKFILWNDSLPSARAIPMYIARVDTLSTKPRACLYADSALFAGNGGQDHFGNGHRFIISSLPYAYDTTVTNTDIDLDSLGTYGCMKFYRLAVFDPPERWKTTRSFDGALWQSTGFYPGNGVRWRWFTWKQTSYDAVNDSAVFFGWGHTSATLYNLSGSTGISWVIYKNKPIAFGNDAVSKTWNYNLGLLHRRRAWWARDDSTVLAWSAQAHYDSISGSEKLEGDAAIKSLISQGQEITAVRENQSVLRGNVAGSKFDNSESISGFSEDDFYKTPIQGILSGNFTIGPLGLGVFSGGGIQEIPTNCKTIFSDSINWAASDRIVAAVYDDRLWLGVPFGSSSVNNRCLVLDPASSPIEIGFVGAMKPGSFLVRRDAGIDEQLYIGQADSSYLYLVGSTADRYEMADWRSGWAVSGQRKLVNEAHVEFSGATGDSIFVDFYADFSETAKYTETIVLTSGQRTADFKVGINAQGYAVAYGFRSPDDVTITGFLWDVVTLGKVVGQ